MPPSNCRSSNQMRPLLNVSAISAAFAATKCAVAAAVAATQCAAIAVQCAIAAVKCSLAAVKCAAAAVGCAAIAAVAPLSSTLLDLLGSAPVFIPIFRYEFTQGWTDEEYAAMVRNVSELARSR
ncbi:hypothetical protein BGZ63DRAFT_171054 [Mariannaea sp. PMI_226]|nr:hypothetical protein BGZ63DRAFT_171054 [Mariannaea sp. PMI_226]